MTDLVIDFSSDSTTDGASFNTYEGFRALVLSYIDTDTADLDPSLADALILLGEKRINREIRCREMEVPLTLTVTAGTAPVPTDYLELKNARTLYCGYLEKLTRVDLDTFENQQVGLTMARDGDSFLFHMLPDGSVVTGSYYIRFIPLSLRPEDLLDPTSVSYQRLYAEHPDLYLYSALEDAETLLGRPLRSKTWVGKYAETKAALEAQSQQERFSGSPMRMRVGTQRFARLVPTGTPPSSSSYYPADYGPADYVL